MPTQRETGYRFDTPTLSLMYGLLGSLQIIEQEDLGNIIARHDHLAEGLRAAFITGWVLKLLSEGRK